MTTYKARLAMVREADAKHEAMMRDAAQKAGVHLAYVRGKRKIKDMDRAMASMFNAAKVNGWSRQNDPLNSKAAL